MASLSASPVSWGSRYHRITSTRTLASPSFRSARRKNYLRHKLVKILNEPFPPQEKLERTLLPLETLGEPLISEEILEEQVLSEENSEISILTQGNLTEKEELERDIHFKSPREFFSLSLCFAVTFVVQTLAVIWFFGFPELGEKSGNNVMNDHNPIAASNSELDLKRKKSISKTIPGLDSNLINFPDEAELEEKISEIRAMANEARASGKKDVKSDVLNNESNEKFMKDSATSRIKTYVLKEVDERLDKMKKSFSLSSKIPNSETKYISIDKLETPTNSDSISPKISLSRKKYRSKNRKYMPVNSSRGFGYSNSSSKVRQMDIEESELNDSKWLSDDILREVILKIQVNEEAGRDPLSGMTSQAEMNFFRAMDRKIEKEGEAAIRWMDKKIEDIDLESHSSNEREKNGVIQRNKIVPNDKLPDEDSLMNSRMQIKSHNPAQNNIWWLKLPYVLVVLLSRGSNSSKGLYTLKTKSNSGEECLSYTVAFEDRRDATNFCYLLESFFEGLEDFCAGIIPMSIEDLVKAVKFDKMKAIVVRKGQIKLYAGQPLPDVEKVLWSLVDMHG